jgi:hypothetical protein
VVELDAAAAVGEVVVFFDAALAVVCWLTVR